MRESDGQQSFSSEDDIVDDKTPEECRVVLEAAENGETELLEKLLKDRPDLVNCRDIDEYTPLHRASYNGHVETMKLLLRRGADPNSRSSEGWTPLHSAVKWCNIEAASLLLDVGADINSQTNSGQTPAHIVSMGKDRKTIEFVIFHPDVDLGIRNSSRELAYDVALRCSPFHHLYKCV